MYKILFVTSEAHPLMKTGGLGDVCGGLPPALQVLGCDVRLLMPAYRDTLHRADSFKHVTDITLPRLSHPVRLLQGRLPGTRVKTWLVDFPPAFDRPGNPYLDPNGHSWPDNAARFALLSRVAQVLALEQTKIKWRPDIVHCHDWQAGLVPALLEAEPARPATIFTIHNLAYQGLFSVDTLAALNLPLTFWSPGALEFHNQLSFIKGGLVYADWLTTVSPTYAQEIQRPEYGCGLDGLLRHRATSLSGILNGIDATQWDPSRDPYLEKPYSIGRFGNKRADKLALQQEVGLPAGIDRPLIGVVSRLVAQKGIDLILDVLPQFAAQPLQWVILGSGESVYEDALRSEADRRADNLAVRIGFDEGLAHRIEAGADMFLMPSRFEPCGLNQLYSLRYGTVPIVRRVGGLTDSVVDATEKNLRSGLATGIVFDQANPAALALAVERALMLYRKPPIWKKLALSGMRQDFSWRHSAGEYLQLYRRVMSMRQVQDENTRSEIHQPSH